MKVLHGGPIAAARTIRAVTGRLRVSIYILTLTLYAEHEWVRPRAVEICSSLTPRFILCEAE